MSSTMSSEASEAQTTISSDESHAAKTRVIRKRRRTSSSKSPTNQNSFGFRAFLLTIVLLLILGSFLGVNPQQIMTDLNKGLHLSDLWKNFRWETGLLIVIAIIMIIMMIPNAEDRILRFLGLRKKHDRSHRDTIS
ncbi:MAG: hypothetical protein WCP07_08370 [bacterium]|jgi:hypothetical protein